MSTIWDVVLDLSMPQSFPCVPTYSVFFAFAFITLFYKYLDLSVLFHCKLLEGRDCIFMFMVSVKYLANGGCSCQCLALGYLEYSFPESVHWQ